MFLYLFSFVRCTKPIFYAPGMFDSELYATITNLLFFPDCNEVLNHIPLIQNPNISEKCRNSLLDTIYNSETNTFSHPKGVIIETDSIQKGNHDLFLQNFTDAYYVYYDWTLYYQGTDTIFSSLKTSIEQNVTNTNEKAILVGYSLGTNFMRYFTTEYVNKEWLNKYIDGIVYLAPGIGGTFTSIIFVATEKVSMITGKAARHMPSQWAMFPNFPLYNDCIEKDGEKIDASNVYNEFKKSNLTDQITDSIYQKVLPFLQKEIPDPGIRSLFIMNSGLVGTCGVKISKDTYEMVPCPSDGSIESRGADFACSHWKNVECYDYKKNDTDFNHVGIGKQQYTAELLMNFVNNQPINPTDESDVSPNRTRKIVIVLSACAVLFGSIIITALLCAYRKEKKEQQIFDTLMNSQQKYYTSQ